MEAQKVKVTKNRVIIIQGKVYGRRMKNKYVRYMIDVYNDYVKYVKKLNGKKVTLVLIPNEVDGNE
jgi:hypothetical protein